MMNTEIPLITIEYFIQSNLIEGVRDPKELPKSVDAWKLLLYQHHLSVWAIHEIHRYIMDELLPPEDVGCWRRHNVTVGGRDCPHWSDVPSLMHDWVDKYGEINHTASYSLDYAKQAHIDFEHIHPFADGNGRTGRMLMWWHEVRRGFVPTLITYEDRWDYYEWF